jgi:hypothetical protein
MIAYVQEIARELASQFSAMLLDSERASEAESRCETLAEELNRLDPRDFEPSSRFAFVTIRRKVRIIARFQTDFWAGLCRKLEIARGHVHATTKIMERGAPPGENKDNWESTHGKMLAGNLEATNEFEGSIESATKLFADTEQILKGFIRIASFSTPQKSFAFVHDTALRTIIERDYQELTRVLFPENAVKSTVIMAGSILEAILFDLLLQDPVQAMGSSEAPRKRGGAVKDITRDQPEDQWALADLIAVATNLGLLPADRERTIDQEIRHYRNYVHPRKEIRSAHPCTEAEAMIAMGALDAVCEHLRSSATGS